MYDKIFKGHVVSLQLNTQIFSHFSPAAYSSYLLRERLSAGNEAVDKFARNNLNDRKHLSPAVCYNILGVPSCVCAVTADVKPPVVYFHLCCILNVLASTERRSAPAVFDASHSFED